MCITALSLCVGDGLQQLRAFGGIGRGPGRLQGRREFASGKLVIHKLGTIRRRVCLNRLLSGSLRHQFRRLALILCDACNLRRLGPYISGLQPGRDRTRGSGRRFERHVRLSRGGHRSVGSGSRPTVHGEGKEPKNDETGCHGGQHRPPI